MQGAERPAVLIFKNALSSLSNLQVVPCVPCAYHVLLVCFFQQANIKGTVHFHAGFKLSLTAYHMK